MLYKITNNNDDIITNQLTLGQAFTVIDNWCYDNKDSYDIDGIIIYRRLLDVYPDTIVVKTKNNILFKILVDFNK